VLVAGALRKHVAKEDQVLRQTIALLVQPGGKTLLEIASRGMERGVEGPRKSLEYVAVSLSDALADVNEIDPGARDYFECNFNRCRRHVRATL
jgi:hypothetical protein